MVSVLALVVWEGRENHSVNAGGLVLVFMLVVREQGDDRGVNNGGLVGGGHSTRHQCHTPHMRHRRIINVSSPHICTCTAASHNTCHT